MSRRLLVGTLTLALTLAGCEERGASPVAVGGEEGPASWTMVETGDRFTCGLSDEGRAFCWGTDRLGALGNGPERVEASATPVRVAGDLRLDTLTVGTQHACGLTPDGRAFCWGNDGSGRLGSDEPAVLCPEGGGRLRCRSAPVAVASELRFRSLSAGGGHTCGITPEDVLYCWGNNLEGQLGLGFFGSTTTEPQEVGSGFATVSAGVAHTCATRLDARLFCWGRNDSGQLGDGGGLSRSFPFAVVAEDVTLVAAGFRHTCALAPARCWGDNGSGQLGTGDLLDSGVPVAVETDRALVEIDLGRFHTCARDGGGAAFCWGRGDRGALGNGETPTTRSSPAAVAGGHAFRQLSAGDGHTCGVTPGGSAFCWGNNSDGQLGDGTTEPRPAPVEVTTSS